MANSIYTRGQLEGEARAMQKELQGACRDKGLPGKIRLIGWALRIHDHGVTLDVDLQRVSESEGRHEVETHSVVL